MVSLMLQAEIAIHIVLGISLLEPIGEPCFYVMDVMLVIHVSVRMEYVVEGTSCTQSYAPYTFMKQNFSKFIEYCLLF